MCYQMLSMRNQESDIVDDLVSPMFHGSYANRGLQTLLEIEIFNFDEFDCLQTSCCKNLMLVKERKQNLQLKNDCLLSCVS